MWCNGGMGKKYHDKEWLRREYVGKKRTTTDIADECGVTGTTISDWLKRHDIGTRSHREAQKPDKPYTDRGWLAHEYKTKERSMREIAEGCDVTAAVILKWLRRFNLKTRHPDHEAKNRTIGITTHGEFGRLKGGYRYVTSSLTIDGEREQYTVAVHQLIAIAEGADPHKVFSNGEYHTHHKNGIKWDNRPENLEFTTREEHAQEHNANRERTETGEWV